MLKDTTVFRLLIWSLLTFRIVWHWHGRESMNSKRYYMKLFLIWRWTECIIIHTNISAGFLFILLFPYLFPKRWILISGKVAGKFLLYINGNSLHIDKFVMFTLYKFTYEMFKGAFTLFFYFSFFQFWIIDFIISIFSKKNWVIFSVFSNLKND